MIPRSGLFSAVIVLALLGLGVAFEPRLTPAWWSGAGLFLFVALFDALVAWRSPLPVVERRLPRSMSLASWTTVHLTVTNEAARRPLRVVVYDFHPQSFAVRDIPAVLAVKPGQFVDLAYEVRPT